MRHRVALAAVVIVLAGLSGCGLVRGVFWETRYLAHSLLTREGRAERQWARAHQAAERGDDRRAEELYRELRAMNPDSAAGALGQALALARLGRKDEGLAALEDAARLGAQDVAEFESDPKLDGFRADDRYRAAAATVEENRAKFLRDYEAAAKPADPREAPVFARYADLGEAFTKKEEAQRKKYSPIDAVKLRAERVAATARYVGDHPRAADREEAFLGELRARVEALDVFHERWNAARAAELAARSAAFSADYGRGSHAHESAVYHALAVMRGVLPDGFRVSSDESPPLRAAEALPELAPVAESAPEKDHWAAVALGLSAVCRYEASPPDADGARAAGRRFLDLAEPEWTDPASPLFHRVRAANRVLLLRIDGLPAFRSVALDGRDVTPQALRGRITLLDFWAPG